MKRMIMAAVMVLTARMVNAQNFDEWFKQKETQIKYLVEQIGALKAYGAVVNKGYDIANYGLTSIFDSKDGDYKQHHDYFLSLCKVKAGIKNYSKVLSIYKMKVEIEKQFQGIKNPTEFVSDKERQYIDDVFSNLLSECNELTDELEMIVKDDQFQLKDDERIARIDKIFLEMQDRYEFSQSFCSQIKYLVVSRFKEQNELQKLSFLYGVK